MIKKFLLSCFTILMVGLFLTGIPVRAEISGASESSVTSESVRRGRRYGPYATLRRANEVANYARRLGYNAKIIYGGSLYYGTRSYYVDVW